MKKYHSKTISPNQVSTHETSSVKKRNIGEQEEQRKRTIVKQGRTKVNQRRPGATRDDQGRNRGEKQQTKPNNEDQRRKGMKQRRYAATIGEQHPPQGPQERRLEPAIESKSPTATGLCACNDGQGMYVIRMVILYESIGINYDR